MLKIRTSNGKKRFVNRFIVLGTLTTNGILMGEESHEFDINTEVLSDELTKDQVVEAAKLSTIYGTEVKDYSLTVLQKYFLNLEETESGLENIGEIVYE